MDAISNANLSEVVPSMLQMNTAGISGHANVTNIGRDSITYEIVDDGAAAGTYDKVASIDDRLRVIHDKNATEETLGWLSAPDPSANYIAARGKHQPGTGTWFNHRAEYMEWKDSPGGVLCIYGAPGSGKTILSSSIVEEIKALCESRLLSGYAYFFFDSRNAEKGLLLYDNLIRSLLTQLTYRCNGIPVALQDIYHKHGDGREQPSLKSLHETLQRVMEGFDHVYIVIDSLDECGNRSELLHWLTTAEIWGSRNLHLLLTSRSEPDIRLYIDGTTHLQRVIIGGSFAQRDIEIYLDARLAKIRHWSQATREAVKKKLMARADGMFRWVALQLDNLELCFNFREIKAQLDTLPKDLEETYERILARSPRRRDLLQLLHWLAFSVRALRLAEFADTVSIDLEADGRPSYDAELRYEDPGASLTVCAGLVTETDGEVKLAHFSVKEYLISEHIKTGAAAFFSIDEHLSHAIIAQTCLAYLLIFDTYQSLTQSNLDTFPLAKYAAKHWIIHYRAARSSSCATTQKLLLSLFDSLSYAMINWVRLNNPDTRDYARLGKDPRHLPVEEIADPIYYASLLGLTPVVAHLLDIGDDPNSLNDLDTTALQAASFKGHLDVAKLLLEHGADANARGGPHETALRAASSNGHLAVAKLLIEHGAEVNVQRGLYDTALQAASYRGDVKVVKLLLESGAGVNLQGGYFGTALRAASYHGSIEVVKLLLESGAGVNILGGHFGTAIQAASYGGYLGIVKLLLEHGAEVNVQGGVYDAALVAASGNGHLDVAKLLLEWRADANFRSFDGTTALQNASYEGQTEAVELLLKHGADANAQAGIRYGTALEAARSQHFLRDLDKSRIVHLLLENGATETAQEKEGHIGLEVDKASRKRKVREDEEGEEVEQRHVLAYIL